MNEDKLSSLLSQAAGQPDPENKQADIKRAIAEFKNSEHSNNESNQGYTSNSRLKKDKRLDFPTTQQRNQKMYETGNRWLYSGLASAAVVVLAVVFLIRPQMTGIQEEQTFDSVELSAPHTKAHAERLEAIDAATSEAQLTELLTAAKSAKLDHSARQQAAEFARSPSPAQNTSSPMIAGEMPMPVPPIEYRDTFEVFDTSPVQSVADKPVSTFAIDVDTASYSFIRRQLLEGFLPPKSAVRLEEMVNYFNYDYPVPKEQQAPFKPTISVLPSPWNTNNRLVHIGIKGYELPVDPEVRSNLVFLLDVSGSMSQPNKLPLVKSSLRLLLGELHPEDTVSIVVYAGAAGTVLEPTKVKNDYQIIEAMERLQAGGSTAGGKGIELAYRLAEANFIEGGVNRIILATDGDFNVGISDPEALKGYVERKRETGIYLSVLGFGQGNYQDALMQNLAQNGNGIASYIDSLSEARKVLVDEARAQLFPIANDVKIQVSFNPATVSEYRLLGYETRALKREDFANDKIDAGEIGSGHTVTAIYEITPVGQPGLLPPTRYETAETVEKAEFSGEYGYLEIRHKTPGSATSSAQGWAIGSSLTEASTDVNFSIAVAGFAQLLKGGKYLGQWTYSDAIELALNNRGDDKFGYRSELVRLIRAAEKAEPLR